MIRTTRRSIAALTVAAALLAACGTAEDDAPVTPAAADDHAEDHADDTDDAPADEAPADDVPADDTPADGETLAITGVDYAFEGLPGEVAVGTTLSFTNASEEEVHELVLVRRQDGETRSVDELLALPQEELFGAIEMVGVSFAMPGAAGEVADGSMTVSAPGDYILICNLPVGTSPEDLESEEPPTDAVPHSHEGMVAEFTAA